MGDKHAEERKVVGMKEVTIEIDEDAYNYFKAMAEECNWPVEDCISWATWTYFKMDSKGEIPKENVKQTLEGEMNLQINLNIKPTLAKSPFADTKKLSKEISNVIGGMEKALNEMNIPHCSDCIVNIEGCVTGD